MQVNIDREGDFLVVEVDDDGPDVADQNAWSARLTNRAAASSDGATVLSDAGGTRVRAELPCVS